MPAGAVRQIDAKTGESFTLVQPTDGRSATGLEYDKKNERLFVSGAGTGAAYVYDAETGAPIADYLLTTEANTFINDNVFDGLGVLRLPTAPDLPTADHGRARRAPAAPDVQTIRSRATTCTTVTRPPPTT